MSGSSGRASAGGIMLKILAGGILGLLLLTSGAAAQSCSGATWTTLTNGNVADATQVMNNFTCVLSSPIFSGNVGIGVTPVSGQPLTIQAPASANGVIIQGRPSDSAGVLMFLNNAGVQQDFLQSNSDGSINLGHSGALVTILASGNVGIGSTNPAYSLVVNGPSGNGSLEVLGASGTTFSNVLAPTTGTTITVNAGGGNCTYSGGSGWSCSSDERLKTNISGLSPMSGLAAIDRLRPVTYRLGKNRDLGPQLGFLAQEVGQVFPQAVTRDSKATSPSTPDGTYLVNYTALIPPTVLAIQQLDARSGSQEAELNELRAINTRQAANLGALSRKLDALEKRINSKIALN
jgi:hypothetical protein